MLTELLCSWLVCLLFAGTGETPASYTALKAEGERLVAEKSYRLALQSYEKAEKVAPEDERRWVAFRLADCVWRSEESTRGYDRRASEKARKGLEALVAGKDEPAEQDRTWAEVHESLGDLLFLSRALGPGASRKDAWPHYQKALSFWASARATSEARERYLSLAFRVADPPSAGPYASYGAEGRELPLEVARNAVKLARTPEERSHAQYLLALTRIREGGTVEEWRSIPELFEAALAAGKSSPWFDDALLAYAGWYATRGPVVAFADARGYRHEPDFVKAVALYERFLAEFQRGQSPYWDQASRSLEQLTKPVTHVYVQSTFLPGSEATFTLGYRNVKRLELSLRLVDLALVDLSGRQGSFLETLDPESLPLLTSWVKDTGDRGEHIQKSETLATPQKLVPGAYLLLVKSEAGTFRDLVLVTDLAVVTKAGRSRSVVFCTRVFDGSPVAGVRLSAWTRVLEEKTWVWRRKATGETDADGLASLEGMGASNRSESVLLAGNGARQAFTPIGGYGYGGTPEEGPTIYAFTDRAAYRPKETVEWKVLVRKPEGEGYSTPAGMTLSYSVRSPRGQAVQEGTLTLNEFGSAFSSLPLQEGWPLGSYTLTFRGDSFSYAPPVSLFRLEEYRLPEFRVDVEGPMADGQPRAVRRGSTAEVTISAAYYSGGPVANARVEVLLRERGTSWWWRVPSAYPWFGGETPAGDRPDDQDAAESRLPVRERAVLETDADGHAVYRFEIERGGYSLSDFLVEARVTDASRREVVGRGKVRASDQLRFADLRPKRLLHRPGQRVALLLVVRDPHDRPASASGTVTISRQVARPAADGTLRQEQDTLDTCPVRTDSSGEATLFFDAPAEGSYTAAFASDEEREADRVRAWANVWVTNPTSQYLASRLDGIELLVEKGVFRPGQSVPVLLTTSGQDRYVLFGIEAADLDSVRLLRLHGPSLLIDVPLEERHAPSLFLHAAAFRKNRLNGVTKEVPVAPTHAILDLSLEPDRKSYRPGETGSLTVRARDHRGRPVAAELALAVTDDAISYVQRDRSGDPRQVFFGKKRAYRGGFALQMRPHQKLERVEDGRYLDEEAIAQLKAARPVPGAGAGGPFRPFGPGLQVSGTKADAFLSTECSAAIVSPSESVSQGESVSQSASRAGQAVVVRSDFRTTALWLPNVITGADGTARVPVRFPDSLTTWRLVARGATRGAQVGYESATVTATRPLTVRLEAPRFLVAGDRATVSAVLTNNSDDPLALQPALTVEGPATLGGKAVRQLEMAPRTSARVDFEVLARTAGELRLVASARETKAAATASGARLDAVEQRLSVFEHGLSRLVSASGKIHGRQASLVVDVPKERRPGSTQVTVEVTPSLAGVVLDALPYMVEYPYGCVEQTMSRFLPAAIVARALAELGIAHEEASRRALEGTHPPPGPGPNPGDLTTTSSAAEAGLARLMDFQHEDGGWGWWKRDASDAYMTAYVLWGLTLGEEAKLPVRREAREKASRWLSGQLGGADLDRDLQAFLLFALARQHALAATQPDEALRRAFDRLWQERERLNTYGRALLALSSHHLGFATAAEVLARNLSNGAARDARPDTSILLPGAGHGPAPKAGRPGPADPARVVGTVHWGDDRIGYRGGSIETTAFALAALLAIDPDNELVEPATSWLVKARQGTRWTNTRDTAITVLTLTDALLHESRSVRPGRTGAVAYEVLVNGKSVARRRLSGSQLLTSRNLVDVDPRHLLPGRNRIVVRRTEGSSPLHASAAVRFFSLEEPLSASGNELFVKRQYSRMKPYETLLSGVAYAREELGDGAGVASGERIETLIALEAKSDLEYVLVEDLKPASFEAVQLRSGDDLVLRERGTDRTVPVYQELRDRQVALFVSRLPQGIWELSYTLRAETPGAFHALPVTAHAMYAPSLRGNGAELRVNVTERAGKEERP